MTHSPARTACTLNFVAPREGLWREWVTTILAVAREEGSVRDLHKAPWSMYPQARDAWDALCLTREWAYAQDDHKSAGIFAYFRECVWECLQRIEAG